MSIVSGVTLICRLIESDDDDGEDLRSRLAEVIEKLGQPGRDFVELSNQYTGGKHPQHFTFGAGINMLDEDAFAKEVMNWEWKMPENVVLVIQPEDGHTRVFRPDAFKYWE